MRTFALSAAVLTAICLVGCSSAKPRSASMGDLGGPANGAASLSLGAGDSLGRSVYVNDLILAAAALDNGTTFTNVDEGQNQLLLDLPH